MNDRPPSTAAEPFAASRALLSAALGGLLFFAAPACSTSPPTGGADAGVADTGVADTGATDAAPGDAHADSTLPGDAEAGADVATDTGGPDANCLDAGIGVTKSVVDPAMTLEIFTKMCEARGGTLELHSHCGGNNTCKGFSYDTGTQTFTEHSCKGWNTCAGYSCVLPCNGAPG